MRDLENIVIGDKAFRILLFLSGVPKTETDVPEIHDTKSTAVDVADIVVHSCDSQLQSESTVYKNLQELWDLGFVGYGIPDGRRNTYYITQMGKEYLSLC